MRLNEKAPLGKELIIIESTLPAFFMEFAALRMRTVS
jgi:hypothetical protein